MINHFIVTRFNQKFNHLKCNRTLYLNEDWLNFRVDLFLKYCAPSVLGQDRGDFYWSIIIDKETPEDIRNKLLIDKRIYLHTCETERKQRTKELSNQSFKYVFSRIDSDDGYRKDFTEQIYQFKSNDEEFLIDINYICFDMIKNIFQEKTTKSSHFISMYTKNSNFNIYYKNHVKLIKNFKYYKINNFLGIEIVHGKNISNQIIQNKKIVDNINLNDYNINYAQQ